MSHWFTALTTDRWWKAMADSSYTEIFAVDKISRKTPVLYFSDGRNR